MRSEDLKIFNEMPVLFWAKNVDGVYIFGNTVINANAGGSVVGKTDFELPWKAQAQDLVDHDNTVLESNQPAFVHEEADFKTVGHAGLSVSKWVGNLDGVKCTFGISFTVDE